MFLFIRSLFDFDLAFCFCLWGGDGGGGRGGGCVRGYAFFLCLWDWQVDSMDSGRVRDGGEC